MFDRKEVITENARKLFSANGYSGTGLRQIAEKSGVSIGNIYNYFKNKKEIFDYILSSKKILESLEKVSDLIDESFPFNLDKLMLGVKKVVDDNLELYTLIFIDIIEFGGHNTDRILKNIIELGQSVFDEKVRDNFVGKVIKPLDYSFAVKIFTVALTSSFIVSNIIPSARLDGYSDEEMTSMLSDILLNGIVL